MGERVDLRDSFDFVENVLMALAGGARFGPTSSIVMMLAGLEVVPLFARKFDGEGRIL